jgi:NAD-specific glutamate dehydrogenase
MPKKQANNFQIPNHYNDFKDHDADCQKIDLDFASKSLLDNEILTRVYKIKNGFVLKVYSNRGLVPLSKIVPILTNLGFNTQTEDTFKISDQSFIHRYFFT